MSFVKRFRIAGRAGAYLGLWAICALSPVDAQDRELFLLHDPSISQNKIVFRYAGALWSTDRDGKDLRRLTEESGASRPVFSPDGSQIAFLANYDGVDALYAMPANGGQPHRLTYHPGDVSRGIRDAISWTSDGRRIVYSSGRAAFANAVVQLFAVPAEGGFAVPLPLYRASEASFSPDGARVAYVTGSSTGFPRWKHYRGGATSSIALARLSDATVEATIPGDRSNNFNPLWLGNTIYFLSDRNGPVTLFAYNVDSGEVRQIVENRGLDIRSAAACADAIVYEQFGTLRVLNLRSGEERTLDIRPAIDARSIQPGPQKIEPEQIDVVDLSPDGERVLLSARGEILTAPAWGTAGGRIQNLTQTTDVDEREPAWSPDGKSIAYFSDAAGAYALHIRDTSETGRVVRIDLGSEHTYYYAPVWSPDSTKIAYTDSHLNFWYVDIRKRKPVRIDTDLNAHILTPYAELAWSPDSRWIAYTRQMQSRLRAIFIHSLEDGRSHRVTDETVDALHPAFDRGGRYLYFALSTDAALTAGPTMNSYDRPVTRRICITLLKKGEQSPLATKYGGKINEKIATGGNVEIDFDGIGNRILALPLPEGNYYALHAGRPGELFIVEGNQIEPLALHSKRDAPDLRAIKFDLKTRQAVQEIRDLSLSPPTIVSGAPASTLRISPSGASMLYQQQGQWFIARDGRENPLELNNVQIQIDPRAEWAHMYEQVWRGVGEFFYDPGLHGLNLEAVKNRYRPYLKNIVSRDDLGYLFQEMLGNLSASHLGVLAPSSSRASGVNRIGLLGADYVVENGRYRFSKIYGGESWNPALRAPLNQPGAEVKSGEYLMAVNGHEVRPPDDVYSFFHGTAEKEIAVSVSPDTQPSHARNIAVIPIANEAALRNYAWREDNRRKVDDMTQGRVGYLHLGDVSIGGYKDFNRYYFAQSGKKALIVDQRYTSGGWGPDYIADSLGRSLLNYFHARDGADLTIPTMGIFGPKVMLINELSGSGADHLPYMFRKRGLGPLVGRRTFGALICACANDRLLDGSLLIVSSHAFHTPDGSWDIENNGVPPDIDVQDDPRAALTGRDPQLEKAVNVALELLEKEPTPAPEPPPYPDYQRPFLDGT